MNTIHSSEVVGQLVLIEADPMRQRVKHAIAGFLAGCSGTTLEAYRLDLRGWIGWIELGAFLRDHALACLLALNGLRISEALGADIDNLDFNRGHRTLFIHRKGNKTATIPLSPRTARALDLYIGEREAGPIFTNHDGTSRLDRHASARTVRRPTCPGLPAPTAAVESDLRTVTPGVR